MRLILLTVIPLLTLSSCLNFGGSTYLDKKDAAVSHPLTLTTDELLIMGPLKVILTNDEASFALMSPSIFDQLDVFIEDGVTIVRPNQKFRPYGYGFFEIHVGIKDLKAITIHTDQSIDTPEALEGLRLKLAIKGAAYGSIASNIENFELNITSAKAIKLTGVATNFDLTTNDIAIINLKKFNATNQTINSKVGAVIKN